MPKSYVSRSSLSKFGGERELVGSDFYSPNRLPGALDVSVSPTGAATKITPISGLSAPALTMHALPLGLGNHYAAMAVARPAPFVVHLAGALAIGARGRATLCTWLCHLRINSKAYLAQKYFNTLFES